MPDIWGLVTCVREVVVEVQQQRPSINLILCICRGEAVSDAVIYNADFAIFQSDRGDLPLCVFTMSVLVIGLCVKQTQYSAAPVL